MILAKMFNIKKGEIISVVGAGGKTSFINHIVSNYRDTYKVLSTTTTKIYKPNTDRYDNLIMTQSLNEDKFKVINEEIKFKNGVSVIGKYINQENKIIGLDFLDIENIKDNFDLIIIEADGSKKKKLKGWNNCEPVIYPKCDKVIGIVDITSINMQINEKNVHNLNEFIEISKGKKYQKINLNNLKNMILHEHGLFKNSVGNKILFINKVENEAYEELAQNLVSLIYEDNNEIDIYYGSIIRQYYKEGQR